MKKYFLSVCFGLMNLFLGFFIAGAGHGWVTGFYFSFFSLIAYPLLKVFSDKQYQNFRYLIFLLNIALTILMCFITIKEGSAYFTRMFEQLPILMGFYFSFWFGWGLQALFLFIKHKRK